VSITAKVKYLKSVLRFLVSFLVISTSIAWCQSEEGILASFFHASDFTDTSQVIILGDIEPFTDRNWNNIWDPAEPFIDKNNNGRYDNEENYQDLNQNEIWDNQEPFTDKGNEVYDVVRNLLI